MRYAAPPLGELRFAAPQDPLPTEGVLDATKVRSQSHMQKARRCGGWLGAWRADVDGQFGNICLAKNPEDWSMKPNPRFTPGEDCLFLNVFAPSGAQEGGKLPVMFFIQGGGFGSNSNANYNASDLAREGNMVVVSINYRVGPYGFLQAKEVMEEGSLNNGIQDQIKALEWVRDYIEKVSTGVYTSEMQ